MNTNKNLYLAILYPRATRSSPRRRCCFVPRAPPLPWRLSAPARWALLLCPKRATAARRRSASRHGANQPRTFSCRSAARGRLDDGVRPRTPPPDQPPGTSSRVTIKDGRPPLTNMYVYGPIKPIHKIKKQSIT
jgi:hypothetical protein